MCIYIYIYTLFSLSVAGQPGKAGRRGARGAPHMCKLDVCVCMYAYFIYGIIHELVNRLAMFMCVCVCIYIYIYIYIHRDR